MTKATIITLYVPGAKPRSFLSWASAFEAVPAGCKHWSISRIVLTFGALLACLALTLPAQAQERIAPKNDHRSRVADTYQPREPRVRDGEKPRRCVVVTDGAGRIESARCGL